MSGTTWDAVKAAHPVGSEVTGVVANVQPYGVWVEFGHGHAGLMMIPDAGIEQVQSLDEVYRPGESVAVTVIRCNDLNQQLVLSRRHKRGD